MGNSVVEIFEDYEERVNLYMLAFGGPSTGKTQSHKNCVTQPILNSLEGKVGGELLLEDATSKGLFKFFSRSKNRVALCTIDECQEWFKEVVGFKSSASAPSMKRLLHVMMDQTGMKRRETLTKGSGLHQRLWLFRVLRNQMHF